MSTTASYLQTSSGYKYKTVRLTVPSQSVQSAQSDSDFVSQTELKEIADSSDDIVIKSCISREYLQEIFDKLDSNKTGRWNLSQFSSACKCIIGDDKLLNIDIETIFNIIDNNDNNTITFDEFCEFILPSTDHKHLSEAFATTVISNKYNKYNKYKYTQCKFEDDYISYFWSRDMGVELIKGINGINAYIKYRFTDYARSHISCGSKIIEINGKNVNGLLFEEILNFLHIVIITKEGFSVKFRPVSKLQNDRYRPNDFATFVYDNIKDSELLKPKFDKKKQRSKSLKKLLSTHKSIINDDLNIDYSATTETMTETTRMNDSYFDFDSESKQESTHNLFEEIENCQIPNCWYKLPDIILSLLCIPRINKISEYRQYNNHCRHCPKKVQKCKLTLHNLLENEKYNKISYGIQIFIMCMIFISTISYIIETLPIFAKYPKSIVIFNLIEYIVSIIFTMEYLLRIISSRNICVFFWDILNLIDFIAIIPFWIELISGASTNNALRVIRVIRLARIFRLMKSPRFAEYITILQKTISKSFASFGLFLTLIFLEIIIASSLVYVAESGHNDNTLFTSIPATSWWAFVTVTTIGYGDMVPHSILGRIICVFTLFSGLLVIALPVIIIGGNFEQEYKKYIKQKNGWNAAKKWSGANKEKQIFTIARLLHFINYKQCKDIFEWEDVRLLYQDGIDSFEIINRILMFDHGHIYLPQQFSSYKKYALFQFYGKQLRRYNNTNNDNIIINHQNKSSKQKIVKEEVKENQIETLLIHRNRNNNNNNNQQKIDTSQQYTYKFIVSDD